MAIGAAYVEWFAEEGKRVYGDVIPTIGNDRRLVVVKQPVGVCAAITPWNFPCSMITRKVAPALAAGCTVVIKPAEATPLLGARAGRARAARGLSAGRAQRGHRQGVRDRRRDVREPDGAQALVHRIHGVGRLLMQQVAPTVKKLSLELGGNAPFIVFDDADLDAAAEGAIVSKYRNAGQTCVCANRLFVQDGVYDAFAAKLAARVRQAQGRPRHRRRRRRRVR